MKISVILCHPKPGSFNHAIAGAVKEALVGEGHSVTVRDLYAEAFDPVYTAAELERDAQLPETVLSQVRELVEADGLVFVHPNYWSRPPALLCGWVDRVLRPGIAYRFVPDGKGGARPEGLLRLQFAAAVVTANTPREKELELYGDPLDLYWRKVVFGMCGIPKTAVIPVSSVITSSAEQRAAWLVQIQQRILGLSRP
jgi:putative NADPH-quinone reductase